MKFLSCAILFAVSVGLTPTEALSACGPNVDHPGLVVAVSKKIEYQYWGFYPYLDPGSVDLPPKYKKQTWRGSFVEYESASSPTPFRAFYFTSIGAAQNSQIPTPIPDGTITFTGTTAAASIDKALVTYQSFSGLPTKRWGPNASLLSVIANYEGSIPSAVEITADKVSYSSNRTAAVLTSGATVYRSWSVVEELSEPLSEGEKEYLENQGENTASTGNSNVSYDKGARSTWRAPSSSPTDMTLQADPIFFEKQTVKFRASFDKLCKGKYHVKFHYVRWPVNTARPARPEQYFPSSATLRGGDIEVQSFDEKIIYPQADLPEIEVPSETGYNIEISNVTAKSIDSSCPNFELGEDQVVVKSVDFSISLGRNNDGGVAGDLVLSAEKVGPPLFEPSALERSSYFSSSIQLVKNTSDQLLQIKAPQCLVDVIVVNASSYELRVYLASQIGALNPQTLRYDLTGNAYVVYQISNPDSTGSSRLSIVKQKDGSTVSKIFTNDGEGVVLSGDGIPTERVESTISGSDRQEIRRQYGPGNTLLAGVTTNYRIYPFGEVPISKVVLLNSSGAQEYSSTDYYSNSATDGASYGQIKEEIDPIGAWTRYIYDSQGRLSKTLRPYLNTAPTWDESSCRVSETIYATVADVDGDSIAETLTTNVERQLGAEVRRSHLIKWSSSVVFGGDSCAKETSYQSTQSGASWDASSNLATTTLTYSEGAFKGRSRAVFSPDDTGVVTTYSTNAQANQVVTTEVGGWNPAHTAMAAGNRTTGVQDLGTNQTIEEGTFDIASDLQLSFWAAVDRDLLGRVTRQVYADGTFIERTYSCCGIDYERDREGRVTHYTYDGARRVLTSSRSGLTTSNTYDVVGRLLAVTRRGSDGSDILQQTYNYDLTGRVISSADASARETVFSEWSGDEGRRFKRTQNPDGGDSIEEFARDGSLLSRSGSAVAPLKHEYGADTEGTFIKEIRLGNSDETTEWTKSYTDFAGRSFKTIYPDSAFTQQIYNAKGQLVRTVDADGVSTLISYNNEGQVETTAGDMNQNGVVDFAGMDRITRTTSTVVVAHEETVHRTLVEQWTTDNTDTARVISISDSSVDGRKSWSTANDLTTIRITTYPSVGLRLETTTTPDGVQSISQFDLDRLSSVVVSSPGLGQLSATTFYYDSHGRLQSSTDARNGATIYTYYPDDRIHTVTSPDPDSSRSGLGYDPQVVSYEYDNAGRVQAVTQPDGGVVNTTYWPTGAVKRVSGTRTYPTEYTYDAQGRVKTLTTWQNFAGDSGRAVSTWNYDTQRGFLSNKRYADSTGPSYTYKPSGRLLSRTWGRTPTATTTYSYGSGGDLSGIAYSDSTPAVTTTYDRVGRPLTTADGVGTRTFTYNNSGQLQAETYDAGALNGLALDHTFDALQRPSGLAIPAITAVTYGYDAASRLQTVTSDATTASYGYAANSSLIESVTMAQAGATRLVTTKTYDKLNRLAVIANTPTTAAPLSHAYAYNAANQRTRATRADNTYTNYGYDPLGQVIADQKFLPDATPVPGYDFAWTYDDIGNRRTATTNAIASSYTANALNQYAQRSVPGSIDVVGAASAAATVTVALNDAVPQPVARQGETFFKKVPVGNAVTAQNALLTITGVKNLVGAAGEDAVTQVTKTTFVPKTPELFTHDADGNLTQDGQWTYSWDAENRLISMETDSPAVAAGLARRKLEFSYDSQGRRFAKKVSNWTGTAFEVASEIRFVFDGWTMVAELNARSGNAVIRTYLWGADLSGSMQGAGGVGGLLGLTDLSTLTAEPSTYFPCYDGNGNVTGLFAAADGINVARYDYNAFGQMVVSEGMFAASNPFKFSTKYTDDESGLLYYGFRYYNPSLGRWLSRDPIEEEGGVNLYGFVGNNPINRIDLLGLWSPLAHDYLLEFAFRTRKEVSEEKLKIMQASSRAYDIETATDDKASNMHSMMRRDQTQDQARRARDAWVWNLVKEARRLRKECKEKEAHQLLGKAFHTLMDSTSPEHVDEDGNLKIWRSTARDGYGHSPGPEATPWYLKMVLYHGDENPRDITVEIYERNKGLMNYYYDLYLQN